MNDIIKTDQMEKIEQVLATGQLQSLTPGERVQYLNKICELTGLNPMTKPFEFIAFQGKTVPYATKGCADQLRKIHKVSIRVVEQKIDNGLITVLVEATDKHGRTDTDMGVIPIGPNMKGDMLANTLMKALTKAKRRVTLSICGLGLLDESEFDTMDIQTPNITTSAPSIENKVPSEAEPEIESQYVVGGGKYEGMALKDVGESEIKEYIELISGRLAEQGRQCPGWFDELKQQVKNIEFFKEKKWERN